LRQPVIRLGSVACSHANKARVALWVWGVSPKLDVAQCGRVKGKYIFQFYVNFLGVVRRLRRGISVSVILVHCVKLNFVIVIYI
jgi:hypothetical protein